MENLKAELEALLEQAESNLTDVGKERIEWLLQELNSEAD